MDEEKKVKKTTTKKAGAKKATTTSSKTKTSRAKAGKTSSTKQKSTTKTSESKKSSSVKSTTGKAETKTKKTTTKKSPVKKVTKEKIERELETVLKEDVLNEEKNYNVLEETIVEEESPRKEDHEKTEETPVFETRKTIKKVIPLSNYLIAAIILVWIAIIAYVGYELSRRHQENLYQEGYFIHENIDIKKISLAEASTVAHDAKDAVFILFNYRGYEETYELEKELWRIMNDYHIEQNFYYVDLTDENGTLNCDMTCVLNTGLHVTNFKNVPAIAYYERGTLIDVAQREDKKVLEAADFVKLLDIYEFKR
jgi:hypothetical protein